MSVFYIFMPFTLSFQGAFEYVHIRALLAMLYNLDTGRRNYLQELIEAGGLVFQRTLFRLFAGIVEHEPIKLYTVLFGYKVCLPSLGTILKHGVITEYVVHEEQTGYVFTGLSVLY